MTDFIYGSGGGGKGGGGGGRTAVEAPNNLKSIQYAKIIDVISEGEIGGLVNGANSIYLDDVPLTEFSDAVYEVRTGTQTQSVTTIGLEGSKETIEVGVLVRKLLDDGVTAGHVIRTVDTTKYDAGLKTIDITIGVPVLTYQDMSNGDINGTSVRFQIAIAPYGGSYTTVRDETISGKCTSMYNASYTISVEGYTRVQYPLSIKVSRITDDSTKSALQNQIYWSSNTFNYPTKLNYPNSALVTLHIDSDHFSSIPTRSFDIYGIKVKVPVNYDPITRVYTGTWNGSFKVAWTDNPAWIYYDLVTDTRYGIGEYITEDRIDKWELYVIAKYCDELVPDGYGTMEPRFTCNTYIQNQEEAYKVLSDLCSIFRGMQYWAGGYFSVSADMPKDAVSEFTSANVIDGVFNYSGSSLKTRHTAAKVIWNDPTDGYKQKVEYVEANGFVYDETNPNYAFNPINKFGIVQADLAAIGCSSRGQANRVGRWLLYTELYETETVTFKTGIENAILLPGNVIKTADPFRQGKRMGGRVSELITTSSMRIDSMEGELANGLYTLSFVIPYVDTNTKQSKSAIYSYYGTINNSIFSSSTGAFNTLIKENAIWIATLTGVLEPEYWRVISIVQEDEVNATITALEYHPGKFNSIEQGMLLEERPTSQIDYGTPNTPTVKTSTVRSIVKDIEYTNTTKLISDLTSSATVLSCSSTEWFTSSGYLRVNNELIQYSNKTSTTFTGLVRGVKGLVQPASSHASGSEIVQAAFTTLNTGWITEFLFFQSPGTLGTAAALSWSANSLNYEIKYKRVLDTVTSWEVKMSNVAFIELKPLEAGLYDIEIRAINALGRRSLPLKRTITLLGKSAPPLDVANFTCNKTTNGLVLSWNANDSTSLNFPDLDLAGYEVREVYYTYLPAIMQEVNGQVTWTATATSAQKTAEWNVASKATDGLITTTNYTDISVSANKYNVFLVKAKDTSDNYSSIPSICGVKLNPPSQITSASISINGTDLVISWQPPSTDVGISYYTVSYINGGTVTTVCNSPEFRKKLWFTGYETFDIIAYDIGGNSSIAKSIEITVGILPAPQQFTTSIVGENYILSWLAPSNTSAAPIDLYEIRTDQNWGQETNRVVTTDSTKFSAKVNWSGDKVFYIAAKDSTGTYGTSTSTTVSSPVPGQVTSFNPTVVDNNVLFSWSAPTIGASLPIIEYELRKGLTWSSAVSIGTKQGLFTTTFETVAGTYTYWLAAINSAGTIGIPRACTAIVNQPPDYVLATNYFSDFINKSGTNGSITTSNAHVGIDSNLILPVNNTETWASHFTSAGFDQIQDFITAGNSLYAQPVPSSGFYQEIIDLGSVIAGSTVSIALGKQVISGNPAVVYEVYASLDNITYSTVTNDLVNYFTQFRYIKVKITVTGGIVKFNTLNIKIDIKQKTSSGSINCVYSDTGGSDVYLTDNKLISGSKVFKDVLSINLTPNIGCTNSSGAVINTVTAIYDFVDIASPLSFKILLYNSTNGERLSGSCSYTVRGV